MRGRMFSVNGKRVPTFNPYTGCLHKCSYCYAEKLITTRLKKTKKYKDCGFKPTFHPDDMDEKFGKNKTIFVCSLADLWGEWVQTDVIHTIVNHCALADNSNTFYFLTKNPSRYVAFFKAHPHMYKDNFVLGVTIETDDIDDISKAPSIYERFMAMLEIKELNPDIRIFVSIEPIMKFGNELVSMIKDLRPEFVYIGINNHEEIAKLPDPSPIEIKQLIKDITPYTEVRLKTIERGV